MNTVIKHLLIISSLLTFVYSIPSIAKGIYQTPEQFIAGVFLDQAPEVKTLWLNKGDKLEIAKILNHSFNRMRIRYWHSKESSAWVLEEIGKEQQITMGVHIKSPIDQIKKPSIVTLKILTYRESRGDEVRHDFYTNQFVDATLKGDNDLSNHIDGITGATLSVRATKKVAKLALWLTNKANNK